MSLFIAPGVMEMKDRDGGTYLVDEELSYILLNRQVWTNAETGHLMIAEVSHKQKQAVMEHRLAVWLYRIMALNDLPMSLNIAFLDGNNRNCCYRNLVRLQKKGRANLDEQTSTTTTP